MNCFAHNMLPSGIYTIVSWARISLRSPSGCLLTFSCGRMNAEGNGILNEYLLRGATRLPGVRLFSFNTYSFLLSWNPVWSFLFLSSLSALLGIRVFCLFLLFITLFQYVCILPFESAENKFFYHVSTIPD